MIDEPAGQAHVTDVTTVVEGAGEPDDANGRDAVRPPGAGRYVVLDELGSGGMGTVVRAYDTKLRREVALKSLRADRTDETGAARLVREAQAMAQLNHSNVVAVFDVELAPGGVLIAMEYVAGRTLRQWLQERPRAWREILTMFVAAGHGLSAAHHAGLVHRDFKPDNVLVGDDGRVRVADFGLARSPTSTSSPPRPCGTPSGAPAVDRSPIAATVTNAGTVIGTPRYMAPEIHTGAAAGPAADQYAFCIALWEALVGRAPFDAAAFAALGEAKLGGAVPKRLPGVPRVLADVLRRGLAVSPSARWSSMDALLDALDRVRARVRMRNAFAVLVVIALVFAARELWRRDRLAARLVECASEGAQFDATWNDETRARLRDAAAASPLGYAAESAERAEPRFDAFAQAWTRARTEACTSGHVHGRWDDDRLARARWCLDEQRIVFEARFEQVAGTEAPVPHRALDAALRLPTVESCLDEEMLDVLPAPADGDQPEIQAILRTLAHLDAMLALARTEGALAQAEDALERAAKSAWPTLLPAAGIRLGRVRKELDDPAGAEAALIEAYFEARRTGIARLAHEAAHELIIVIGHERERTDEGLVWARLCAAEEPQLNAADGLLVAGRLFAEGMVHDVRDAPAESRAAFETALEILERLEGPEGPDVVAALGNLAVLEHRTGAYEAAVAKYERLIELTERTRGPDHPALATALSNLASSEIRLRHKERARNHLLRALAIRQKAFGEDHVEVAETLQTLAVTYDRRTQAVEIAALQERALTVLERSLGHDHPRLAMGLNNLGITRQAAGDIAGALALHRRALAIRERAFGHDHRDVAASMGNLADANFAAGRYGEALELDLGALAIFERRLGPEHPDVAWALHGVGKDRRAMGQPAAAIEPLERALAIRERQPVGADRARTAFLLARARWEADKDRSRAITLARTAADMYRADGDHDDDVAEVEAWLREREPSKAGG